MIKTLKIIEKVFMVILVLIIIFFGYYIINRLVNKNSYSRMFGYYMFEVTSGSMYNPEDEASLNVGSLVFVKKLDSSKYEVGMTVTFKLEDSKTPTTHQIIRRDGDMIVTKGVNPSNSEDPEFDVKYIIGQVKGVWQNYSKFIDFIKSPFGILVICVSGLGLFLLIDGSHKLVQKLEKKQEETSTESLDENEFIVEEVESKEEVEDSLKEE